MDHGHTEMDLRDRHVIEDMLNAKAPLRKIAAHLRSVVHHLAMFPRCIKLHVYVLWRDRGASNDPRNT